MIDSQIGEQILLEIVRFRHFGEILYLAVKLVVTSKCTYAPTLHSRKVVCCLPAGFRGAIALSLLLRWNSGPKGR
jgi:hypothetical protein